MVSFEKVDNQKNHTTKIMKQMTCAQMGGPCDAMISGSTPKEMTDRGMDHVMHAHPDMAEKMKMMPKEEMDKWGAEFQKKWDATPDM